MPNKIKDIFSNDTVNINGTVHFSDEEAYKNFLSALEMAYAEGRVVPVEGITSVTETVGHMGTKFPIEEYTGINKIFVGPAVEPVPIVLNVNGEEKTITLLRSRIKDKVILRSEPDSIVSFKFTFPLGENIHTVNYKVQFERAKSIREVADSFNIAAALLTHLYSHEDNTPTENDKVSLSEVKEYFTCYKYFFERLSAIESKLAISISPNLLNDLPDEEHHDIDELYLLLCEKKVVRSNAKLTYTDISPAVMNSTEMSFSIGHKIALTFTYGIEFNFLNQTVALYTANLLVNALVKDIQKGDDGTAKILYGDTDSKPMYISFSAFETIEEAEQELNAIPQHSDIYVNAKTSNTYINKYYEEKY